MCFTRRCDPLPRRYVLYTMRQPGSTITNGWLLDVRRYGCIIATPQVLQPRGERASRERSKIWSDAWSRRTRAAVQPVSIPDTDGGLAPQALGGEGALPGTLTHPSTGEPRCRTRSSLPSRPGQESGAYLPCRRLRWPGTTFWPLLRSPGNRASLPPKGV